MFRLLFFLVLGILLALWVEPDWNSSTRTLTLHVRDASELRALATERARELAERAADEVVSRWRGEDPPAATGARAVGSGPPTDRPLEEIEPGERRRLDQIVREKTR